MPLEALSQFLNIRAEELAGQVARAGGVRTVDLEGEQLYTTHERWNRLAASVRAELNAFHDANRLAAGRDMEELRDKLPEHLPSRLFRAIIDELARDAIIARDGSLVRLPAHHVAMRPDESRLIEQVTRLLAATPMAPPDLGELERQLGITRTKLGDLLRAVERTGAVVRVSNDLYFLKEPLDEVARTMHDEFSGNVDITPAMFRDRFKTTRKYTIPLLGYFDREGVTMRIGDVRRVRS